MLKQPVSLFCAVVLSPGATGPPDSGTITIIPQGGPTVNDSIPLATTGSTCTMTNSATGVTYPLVIGSASRSQVTVKGKALIRTGDNIPSGSGMLLIIGPPASPFISDSTG